MSNRPKKAWPVLMAGAMASLLAPLLVQAQAPAAGISVKAAKATNAAPTPPLHPNLIALPAKDVQIQRTRAGRNLRFEGALGNIGAGPVEVRPNHQRPCPEGQHNASQVVYRDLDGNGRYRRDVDTASIKRSAGCMVFHRYHDHWHFEAASRYTLFRADRPQNTQVVRRKMSFCLRDSARTPARYGAPTRYAQHYGACSRYSPQGISIGWVDIYQSFLAGQAIPMPARMRDGLYCLQVKVDPRNLLSETDDGDNTSLRAFSLTGDRVTYRATKLCRGLI